MEIYSTDKELLDLLRQGKTEGKQYRRLPKDVIRGYLKACKYIAAAKRIEDLYQYGSLHYEKLRGDMAGCESVRCTLRWRLIFKSFPNENSIIITNVELIKISNHYED